MRDSVVGPSMHCVQYFEGGSLIPNKSPGRLTFPDVTLERGASRAPGEGRHATGSRRTRAAV